MKEHGWKKLTPEQSKDAGLALVLIFLILYLWTKTPVFLSIALICLITDMTFPVVFKPFAWLWFGLAVLLGRLTNKVLLTVVYFLVLFPMALIRRLMGYDSLQLRKFKKASGSVFLSRDKTYQPEDLANPF